MGSTAAEECLGRHDDSIDCKHAAYGFIPGPGVVTVERDGEFLNAFPFQDPS